MSTALAATGWRRWAGTRLPRHPLIAALVAVISVRIVLTLVGWGACAWGCDARGEPLPQLMRHPGGAADVLLWPWQRNDAVYYQDIALHGYNHALSGGDASNFFPLFPLLMRGLGFVLGGNLLWAGTLISTASFLVSVILIQRLTASIAGESSGYRAAFFLSISPIAYTFISPLTESLFIALSLGAVLAIRKQRPLTACLLATAATISRPQGILLAVPLAIEMWQQPRVRRGLYKHWIRWSDLSILLLPLGFAGFQLYLTALGVDNSFTAEAKHWGVHLEFPGVPVVMAVIKMFSQHDWALLFDIVPVVLLAASIPWMWRHLPRSLTAYTLVMWLAIVSHTVTWNPISSALRFSGAIFPIYIVLGIWSQKPRMMARLTLILGAFMLLTAFQIARFHLVE